MCTMYIWGCPGCPGAACITAIEVFLLCKIIILSKGFDYYLSDSSGLPITKDGKLVLHKRDGNSEIHEWNWLTMSGIRYQSRARLFCVQKAIGMYILVYYTNNYFCLALF